MLLLSISDGMIDGPQRRAFLATDARTGHDAERAVAVHFCLGLGMTAVSK